MRSRDMPSSTDSDTERAFSMLADETRLAILRVLADAPNEPLSFSELREQVGVTDSGRFNYHLGKLTDHFVKKSAEGYELRLAGWNIVGAVLAGAYERGADVGPIPLDVPCPACEGTVEATYSDERFHLRCADCNKDISDVGVPPGVFEGYSDEEIPTVADQYTHSLFSQARRGFCVSCYGHLDKRLVTSTEERHKYTVNDAHAVYSCTRCREELVAGISLAYLDHPAVVSFYYDHGVDLSQPHLWGTAWRDEPTLTVVSEDPVRATVDFELDGDTLTLTIDEGLEVHDVERSPAP